MSNDPQRAELASEGAALSPSGRILVLAAAFLGWLFAGTQMSITSLAMRSAAIDLLARTDALDLDRFSEWNRQAQAADEDNADAKPLSSENREQLTEWKSSAARWFAWYQCAFLFGAAAGGLIFGRLGDQIGRSKAMAASILCYSLFSGAAYWVQSPEQLLVLRFACCLGIGGMWPNGVALVSEAWSNLSRPMAAGVIGTAANVGIFLMATLAANVKITPEDWRWVMLVGAAPVALAVLVLLFVPESPRWLASRREQIANTGTTTTRAEVFRPPFLWVTLVGILLATIPLVGGWGSANWMIPWAGEAGEQATPPNPYLKAYVGQARALTGMIGSLLGGWIGSIIGRKRSYLLTSAAALFCAQYAFWFTVPTDGLFLYWVAALGFFSGIYFGWLPLFLPELFPTRVRSTGAGVCFNFGRILTAFIVLATGAVISLFDGDYARLGRVTSLVFAFGLIAIIFAPDTSRSQLED